MKRRAAGGVGWPADAGMEGADSRKAEICFVKKQDGMASAGQTGSKDTCLFDSAGC